MNAPRGGLLAAVVLLALLLLATAAAPRAGALGPPPAYPTYDSGQIAVRFPGPLPGVELVQDANNSIAASLVVAHILEIQPPVSSGHPLVVQVGTPTNGSPFQSTSSTTGVSSFGLHLQGLVPVVPVHTPLWTSPLGLPNATPPASGPVPLPRPASLTVSYALDRSSRTSQGLNLSWNILSWPWISPHDLLGVELLFAVPNATDFDACATPSPVLNSSPTAGCAGQALAPGAILWQSPTLGSVVGRSPSGLAASLAWGSFGNATGAGAPPIVAGTYFAAPGTDRVTLAAAALGSTNVSATGRLMLTIPPVASLAPLPAEVRADPWAYAAALGAFSALAIVGVGYYRQRERRSREEL
jgi:hypothetical protein